MAQVGRKIQGGLFKVLIKKNYYHWATFFWSFSYSGLTGLKRLRISHTSTTALRFATIVVVSSSSKRNSWSRYIRRADVAPSLFGLYGQLGPALCCLTIESEERETWTAEVLADRLSSEGQSMRYSDGHVF